MMYTPTRHRLHRWALACLLLTCWGLGSGCGQVDKVREFLASISDGAPCEGDGDCLGGTCLKPADGFTGGYCTTLQCEQNGCSNFFADCFRTKVGSNEVTACFEQCNLDGTCDRAAEGYQCVTLNDQPVCLPPNATNAPVQGAVGSSCSSNPQCNGEGATCLQSFFGGYCAILSCTTSADCPDSNPCVALNPAGTTAEEKKLACMKGCSTDDDCRFGYSCQEYEGEGVCLEKGEGERAARNPDGVNDGQACVSNINCKGGTCIREAKNGEGETSYPGGYCTTRGCENDAACNGDAICVSLASSTACRARCAADSDCRSGYACRDNAEGTAKYCDSVADPPPVDTQTVASQTLNVECSASKSYTFTVPEGSVSFYLAPFTKDGKKVEITTLQRPDGSTLNVPRDYAFMAINPQILGALSPILFPASDQANLKSAFPPGQYTLNVNSSASEICYYTLPQPGEGTTLALSIYLVGVEGVTAANAANNTNIKSIVNIMQTIYRQMGITVTVEKYTDASAEVTKNYSIIRDIYDVYNLVATSAAPGEGLQGALAVNVFLIQDFNVADAPGLLGLSTGIPGVAGLHGTAGSGLVFSTAALGKDNATIGQTMAHEVGHFLGLRHTTEHGGSSHDPITDTPECALPDLAFICRDAENFMFPFSLDGGKQTKTTAGQSFVLRRNPLVRQ